MRTGLIVAGTVFMTFGVLLLTFFILFYSFQLIPHQADNEVLSEQHREVMTYLIVPVYAHNTLDFMSEAEQNHMGDVKKLFSWAFFLCILCLIVFALMRKLEEEELMRVSKNTAYAIFGLFGIVLLIWIIGGFSRFWTLFHKILFPQGNWQFAADSTLITLYPGSFFSWFVVAYGFLVLLAAFFLYYTSDINDKIKPLTE